MIDQPNELDLAQTDNQGAAPVKPLSPFKRLLRWLRNLIRLVFYLPLALLIMLALMIGTPLGTRLSVILADALVPNLSLSYSAGRLNGQLTLDHAHWQMAGIVVDTQDLTLNWRPLCLLQRQLCVDTLSASAVQVDIDTDELKGKDDNPDLTTESLTTEGSEPIKEEVAEADDQRLVLPFGIVLNQGDLKQVKVRVNQMQFNADALTAKASWLETGLRVNQLASQGLYIDIPLSAETDQAADADQADADSWPLTQLPEVAIPMPIFVDTAELTNSELRLGQRIDHFQAFALQGSYVGYKITLDSLDVQHDYGKAHLDGHMSLEQDYPMALNLQADLASQQLTELPQLKRQQLEAEINGGFAALAVTLRGKGHLDLNLDGEINLDSPQLPYRVALTSPHLMWPLAEPEYETKILTLNSQGSIQKQSVTLSGDLKTPYHPWLTLDAEFEHQTKQLSFAKLDVDSEMGKAKLTGQLAYGDKLHWDLQLDTQTLDLSQLNITTEQPLPETEINGSLHSQGDYSDKQWAIGVSNADLQGHVANYPLRLQGDIAINDKFQLNAKQLQLNALESELTLSGRVDDNWSLDGQLSVPALSLWDPKASGAIEAVINVSGDDEHPEIAINADSVELQYADIQVEKAKLIAFYRPQDEHQFALSLKSSDIKRQNVSLSTLTLGIKGDLNKQKLGLQTYGDIQLQTSIASSFDDKAQRFDASVNRINLKSRLGAMALDKPIALYWDQQQGYGEVAPFCWQHEAASLCLTDIAELGDKGDTQLQFSGDLGALLSPILPDRLTWRGPTQLDALFHWAKGEKPTGEIELAMAPGQFDLTTNRRQINAQYKYLQLSAQLSPERFTADAKFESERFAKLNAGVEISTDPEQRLSGQIDLKDINLHALADFTPQLEVLDGRVSSAITLGGTLESPQLTGSVDLIDGQLAAAANPTLLDNIALTLSLVGQGAKLTSQWTMGEGKAELEGDLNWQEGLQGDFQFKGDKLAIIQPPLAILDVSPDLTIGFSNKHLDIQGNVDIPSGHIKIVQLPEGGVAQSDDVIFNDSLSTQVQEKNPIAITSQIMVNVGDKLNIDGMGLRGMLQGTLELRQAAFKPPLLYGDIRVVNGTYKFMGQTLSINAGEVQFIGPMAVPNLNIEATREIKEDDVIAGVRITGTPAKPVVTLFSNPAKEQAEILSYIIKGTGLNNSDSDQNNALMMGAALTLGNQLGDNAFSNVGSSASGVIEKLGISNVQLDANDDGKVAISGYIGDDLMVKYGVGVFNPGYEMTVRYYLMSQLYLESVSGTISKTLDIYYSFDID
ncbi:autotransporter assembly complex protein TamB [Shewanella marisflavi]|uniref:Translocation and assembly module TamB C-terminal domain-containing protein n=1 Tax=Shewanella marisflavi TaxID=260364 RepID=A0AAC9TZK3_9GAMM|nr:translocation/assembly module TamB domain-containing protein [Shewanella marisflavi]ASJ96603.1 hypothetical protein CFF01_08365 [Shewanella marisflavi]